MKINIDYPVKRLIWENLLYLLGFIALSTAMYIVTFFYLNQYQNNSKKISALELEIGQYHSKQEALDFKNQLIEDETRLDYVNGVFSQLIPAKEDYFSIIASLDKLSLQSNFIITSYNIVIGSSTPEKLAIVIEGQGDPNTFLEFLKDYNFSGGRLITIDKIDFNQEAFTGTKVNINVYTAKASSTQLFEPSIETNMDFIENILQKVQLELKAEEAEESEYPTKSNPF